MQEITLTIINQVGLHARPAALFVESARRFQCELRLTKDDREVDAKSILSILTLGAGPGSHVKICARGSDEEEAIQTLRALVESNFGEEG